MDGFKRVVDLPEKSDPNIANNADNPLGSVTVPEFGRTRGFPVAVHHTAKGFDDTCLVRAYHNVCPMRDRDGSFRIVSKGKAWHAQYRGLLLKTTGVCQHDRGACFQIQEF